MHIQHAAKKNTIKYYHEILTDSKKKRVKSKSKQDKTTVYYAAGAFGTRVLPENNIEKSFKIRRLRKLLRWYSLMIKITTGSL